MSCISAHSLTLAQRVTPSNLIQQSQVLTSRPPKATTAKPVKTSGKKALQMGCPTTTALSGRTCKVPCPVWPHEKRAWCCYTHKIA